MLDALMQRIVASMTESVVVLGADEAIAWTNPAFGKLFGYTLDEVAGKPIGSLLADEDLLSVIGFSEAFAGKETCDLNVVFCTSDNVIVPTTVTGRNLGEGSRLLVIRDEREMQRLLSEATKAIASEKQKADELARAHKELRLVNAARERAEVSLRHAQKLEAVGRLAAGVAHEINTPVQFVSDSTYFLKDAFEDITVLLARYRQLVTGTACASTAADALDQLREAEEDADLEYLREELPEAVKRALEGLERITKIVRAMKEFAHPDQREKRAADLNKAIKNTLIVARNEYKYVAEAELELGDLPPVTCHIGDLGQVLINMVVNAAHAIGDAGASTQEKGTIRISTEREGDMAVIRISDTGSGIPENVRERIFEPFFTTKEVGKGSGQGLAIAHSIIIDKHNGSICVESEIGRGTTFVIRIPIDDRTPSKEQEEAA